MVIAQINPFWILHKTEGVYFVTLLKFNYIFFVTSFNYYMWEACNWVTCLLQSESYSFSISPGKNADVGFWVRISNLENRFSFRRSSSWFHQKLSPCFPPRSLSYSVIKSIFIDEKLMWCGSIKAALTIEEPLNSREEQWH